MGKFQTFGGMQSNQGNAISSFLAIFVVFALTFPWMLRVLTGFSRQLILRLPEMIR